MQIKVLFTKKELMEALNQGRISYITEGDLTPNDAQEILLANIDRLTDPNCRYDIDISSIFGNEPLNSERLTKPVPQCLAWKKIPPLSKQAKPKTTHRKAFETHKDDLPFAPTPGTPIDLSPDRFAHSDAFSKMMDKASRRALNDRVGYASGRQRGE